MKNIVIWGTGVTAKMFTAMRGLLKNTRVVCAVDNDEKKWGRVFNGITVMSPIEIRNMDFDQIIICARNSNCIKMQLIYELNVDEDKILLYTDIEEQIVFKLKQKYIGNKDKEIQNILLKYSLEGINIFGDYTPEIKNYEVFYDDDGYPFVFFDKKKVYYPKSYEFFEYNEKKYVPDIFYEQYPKSPHLYVTHNGQIPDEGIIIDAGACEGNFTIKYIDKIKKAYIVEADPIWVECLKKTFEPYKQKVVICDKFLTKYNSESTITIDTLVGNDSIDFLKMDIEGEEINALLGGKKTLEFSNARCAICSYHKSNDEENIKFIMNALGYNTKAADGYMFFIHDEDILETLDFRRGVVYAYK